LGKVLIPPAATASPPLCLLLFSVPFPVSHLRGIGNLTMMVSWTAAFAGHSPWRYSELVLPFLADHPYGKTGTPQIFRRISSTISTFFLSCPSTYCRQAAFPLILCLSFFILLSSCGGGIYFAGSFRRHASLLSFSNFASRILVLPFSTIPVLFFARLGSGFQLAVLSPFSHDFFLPPCV